MTRKGSTRVVGDSGEPLFVVDSLGLVNECNASAARLLRVEPMVATGGQCRDLLRGRARDGTPICRSACPYLDAAQVVGPSPIDVIVAGDPGHPGMEELEIAMHHIRVFIRGQMLVLHVFEDVRAQRGSELIGARLNALRMRETIPGPLTRRELDVLRLVAEGMSSGELAGRLGIRPATVRNHVSRILRKLGAKTRAEALAKFLAGEGDAGRDA